MCLSQVKPHNFKPLAVLYSSNMPLKCESNSSLHLVLSLGATSVFRCVEGRVKRFKNVWAKWRSQWIGATGCQSLPVAGWLPGAPWGAGCPPGPPHRLLHRPVRRGGRVHQKVGAYIIILSKDVFLSSATFVAHFITIILYLYRREVDLDGKNFGGWTPLMYASYIGHDNIANLLLEAGVNVNATTAKGLTPLMLAASCGNESIAYFLLQVQNDSDSSRCAMLVCSDLCFEAKFSIGWI